MKKKKWFIRILAIMILLIVFAAAEAILGHKSPHGIDQADAFYSQPKNSIDVLFIGSSHVHCGINTAELWEKYGIASYDYSAAEQPLWTTYYYLKEAYKYQAPKVVVLDVYSPIRFKDDYQYDFMDENVHGMRFSLNKLQMLSESIEPHRISEYFPSFFSYHNRYDELTEDDFKELFWNKEDKTAFKGYTPYFGEYTDIPSEYYVQPSETPLTPKSEKYLKEICALTKEHGSQLLIIVIPYLEYRANGSKEAWDEISKIAAEENVISINYNEYLEAIGIDESADFYDESHLNYQGSTKFTGFLGSLLIDLDGIEDRRGLEQYASWEDHAAMIRQIADENSGKNN